MDALEYEIRQTARSMYHDYIESGRYGLGEVGYFAKEAAKFLTEDESKYNSIKVRILNHMEAIHEHKQNH